jgi:uncharacterized protein (TIGR02757 family)
VNELNNIKDFLDEKYHLYASPKFIESDPIQIPRSFSQKEDIEIAGFLTAIISWGQRPQIIKSAQKLMSEMGDSPYQFICDANSNDIEAFAKFYYRTFNGTDCIAFFKSLKLIYEAGGLENIFNKGYSETNTIKGAIIFFRNIFLHSQFPDRSRKHISSPLAGSAAKRINMFLRWMIRPSTEGVDFGLWKDIPPSALMLPLDLHSGRVARRLGLLARNQSDWKAVEMVTHKLSIFDPNDPVKYDYALFGLGIFEKF